MKPCQSRREALNLHGILAAANCWRVQRARPHGRKGQGSIRWHKHDSTDDFFVVLKGRVTILMRDGNVSLGPERCSWCRRAPSIVPWLRRNLTSS
jgi:hypothetical protein